MKKASLRFSISLCLAACVFACNNEKKSHDHSGNRETAGDTTATIAWKEMDEFHMVMAESFHPYMDSTNLEPAKSHADDLAQVAAKWAAAPLPEKVNNDEVRAKLEKLNTASKEFATIAKAGNDEATGKALTDLHHLFHEIQNAWYSGKVEHKHEHEH